MLYLSKSKNTIRKMGGGKKLPPFFFSMMRKYFYLGIIMMATLLTSYNYVFAAMNLAVVPVEGGESIRFGRVDKNSYVSREVRIRINSTDGVQYELRQALLEPLTSDTGMTLNEGVVKYYTVRGTNAYGSLYGDTVRNLSVREDVLYTSNTTGTSDSFTVVYVADGKALVHSGHFRGRIIYTLEPRGGGSPQHVIMNVDLDAEAGIDVSIKTSSGASQISLETTSPETEKDFLVFNLGTSIGESFRVYQKLESGLQSSLGKILPPGLVKFFLSGARNGEMYYRSPACLMGEEVLIYSSVSGREDSFQINFFLDESKIEEAEAGSYRGRITYTLEGRSIHRTFTVDIEVRIHKVFNMDIIAEDGLTFSHLAPNTPPQERAVEIKVKTNLSRPYQVTQIVPEPMTDRRGRIIPERFFQMKVEPEEKDKGEAKFLDFTPVKTGSTVIFTSNDKGDPASFRVIYRLLPSLEIPPGNYSAQVTYSLSEN